MPRWLDHPPDAAKDVPYRIVRTPADKPLEAIITTPELLGCCTHFVHNRTVPCEGPDTCSHCAQGHAWRWHGYVAAILRVTLEHVLFEITAPSADTLRNYILLHGNLRGCRIKAFRPSNRPNGRVVLQTVPVDLSSTRLPDAPNVKRLLCHLWNVQYSDTDDSRLTRPPFRGLGVGHTKTNGRYRSTGTPK